MNSKETTLLGPAGRTHLHLQAAGHTASLQEPQQPSEQGQETGKQAALLNGAKESPVTRAGPWEVWPGAEVP